MKYDNIFEGRFLERPNRFVARVWLAGREEVCHVKNTGRCRELLIAGARVLVQKSTNPARKTGYDLIAVWKGDRLINMDAAAPNAVFAEWAAAGYFLPGLTRIQPEFRHRDSRFDFYAETLDKRILVEVKGVTLEQDGAVFFPDAPTERGVKHLRGLTAAIAEGFEAWIVFVVQMSDVAFFAPNDRMHLAFGQALREAAQAGVHVLALDCRVTENSLSIRQEVSVRL